MVHFFKCGLCKIPHSKWNSSFCENCRVRLIPAPPLCNTCGSPFCTQNGPCLRPWAEAEFISSFHAFYQLSGQTYEVLKLWKKKPSDTLRSQIFSRLKLPEQLMLNTHQSILIPVPQTWQRSWHLTRSPALEIARFISQHSGIPVVEDVLGIRTFLRQGELGLESRFSIEQRFELKRKTKAPVVFLIDDFMTTGITVRQAARILAPCSEVHVIVLGVRLVGSGKKALASHFLGLRNSHELTESRSDIGKRPILH